MPDPTEEFIAGYVRDIDDLVAKADQKKRLVNQICADRGLPPRYPDVGGVQTPALRIGSIRRDSFHGRPMATAIREYLQMRGPSDRGGLGAATVNEIYSALVEGGFVFETKNDLNAKRGLRDALSKNTNVFRSIGGAYGLSEWYQKGPKPPKPLKNAKVKRSKKVASGGKRGRPRKAIEAKPPTLSLVAPPKDTAGTDRAA